MPEKATWALAEPPSMSLEDARAELVRRFLRVFGPATHSQLASWAQTAPSHAKQLFEAVEDELAPASVEGRQGFVLAADVDRLEARRRRASGVRLLGGHDPYVAQPDRASLVPDAAVRKRLFPSVGRPGVVLADGVPHRPLARAQAGRRARGVRRVARRAGRRRARRRGDRAAPRLRAAAGSGSPTGPCVSSTASYAPGPPGRPTAPLKHGGAAALMRELDHPTPALVEELQHSVGNRAVTRLLQREPKTAPPPAAPPSTRCSTSTSSCSPTWRPRTRRASRASAGTS